MEISSIICNELYFCCHLRCPEGINCLSCLPSKESFAFSEWGRCFGIFQQFPNDRKQRFRYIIAHKISTPNHNHIQPPIKTMYCIIWLRCHQQFILHSQQPTDSSHVCHASLYSGLLRRVFFWAVTEPFMFTEMKLRESPTWGPAIIETMV